MKIYINMLNVLFIALFSFGSLNTVAAPAKPDVTVNTETAAINQYSKDLNLILNVATAEFGVNKISIAGGTARSVILAGLMGRPFQFRDFDIVFSADKEVTAEQARRFGMTLQKSGLGIFSNENLRPRPRFNPEISDIPSARAYNAGFGFFVNSKQGVEYDISLFHSAKDLSLNGIMDVDRFQIPIKKGQTLVDLMNNQTALRKALIDPENALHKVLENKAPAVANWGAVSGDPAMIGIRMVRTLGKFNALPLDTVTKRKVQELLDANPNANSLQIARNLIKLFDDPNWEVEFRTLVEMGLFKNAYKSFAVSNYHFSFGKFPTVESKISRLLEGANKEDSLLFLKSLAELEPDLIQKVLPTVIKRKSLKVGYYTGEFAPFHRGHESVVSTALQKGGLDLVFVIATPHATNDPKTPEFDANEWGERRAFVKTGVQHLPNAWAWPMSEQSMSGSNPTLESEIKDLHKYASPYSALTHIFGMDSYHRVLGRNLVAADPRPRIAVTRAGVPIPSEDFYSVKVIENTNPTTWSATRIMHEVAVTGTTEGLAPGVLALINKIPRYKEYLESLITERNQIRTAIPTITNYSKVNLVWDPRENKAGLWIQRYPDFTDKHAAILNRLMAMGPAKILIPLPEGELVSFRTRRSWVSALARLSNSQIEIVGEVDPSLPRESQIPVLHSGVVNEHLKGNGFDKSYGGRGLVIFETPDQPTSLVLKTVPAIKVLSTKPVGPSRCEKVHLLGA